MVDRISAAGFIGRERELAELEASLADALEGRPRLVFVAGESGVGKSRLLSEFELRAQALGARTVGGECIELGEDELPFAPLVGAVRPLARASEPAFDRLPEFARGELARLAPELGSASPERGEDREGESQRRLFDALLSLLERLGDDDGVVFWLEDIHWADRSTRAFLAFLSANVRDERVLVVSTYRSDELHRRHPLRPLLNELERGPCARRLELPPFDRDEISAQLADILGSPPSEEVVDRLFARSEGNPLFTEELLAGGLDGRGALPPTLREALLTRLDELGPATRQTLGLLAVASRADDATLAAAGSLEPTQLREALREAMGSHLIKTDDADRFAFRHALFREVVYDDLLPGERSELHLSLARVLEERAKADDGTWLRTAIAHHYHQAGDQREALRTAVLAADRSEAVHAPGEAAKLFDRALGLWPRVEDPESLVGCRVTDLLTRAARAHYMAGDDPPAKTLLEQALDELDPEDEPLAVARLMGELANVQWSLGHAEHSRESLDRALELCPDEPTEVSARLLGNQVKFKLLQGRFGEIEPIAERAIEMADALDLKLVKAAVLNRFGPALFPLGEPERGEEMMREGLDLAQKHGAPDDLAVAYVNYADVLHVYGRSEDGLRLLDEGMPSIEGIDRSSRWLALLRAEINFALGNWAEAAADLPPARGLALTGTRVNSNLRQAEQAMGEGHLDRARPLLTESWEMLTYSVEPQFIAMTASLLAELEVREREIETARETITDGLDRIQYCTEDAARIALITAAGVAVEAAAAENARDLGDAEAERNAIDRAEMLLDLTRASAEEYDGPVEKAVLAGATAQAARAAARPETAELWSAAAQEWRGLGRPYEEARALWRRAEALIALDDRASAGEAAGAALAIVRGLGAAWLIAELESLAARARLSLAGAAADGDGDGEAAEEPGDPFGLTDRERQVLALVAAGATNREIAGELFMAEKTASVHVSRILGKLGVRSRTEAAAVAYRQGLAEAPSS
jgi:DNA-binding CsgD family transcriptional regulator/tetratricopeptide (TPR) repeat protein